MSKLLLTVLLTVGITLVAVPAMAKRGADDPAGHEHGGGATGGQVHVEHERHGGGTTTGNTTGGSTSGSRHGSRDANEVNEANEANEHAAGHDVNDADDAPLAPPAAP